MFLSTLLRMAGRHTRGGRTANTRGFLRMPPSAVLSIMLALGSSPAAAMADADDALRLQVSHGLLHDSNVYRLPPGDSRRFGIAPDQASDTVGITSATGLFDRRFGRQRVQARLSVDRFDYRGNDNLSHDALSGQVGLLWEYGNRWNGEVRYAHRRYLTGFTDFRASVKNLIDQDNGLASVRFRFHPRWYATGSIEGIRLVNSETVRQGLDFRSTSAIAGVQYVTPSENSIGLRLRATGANYPNRQAVGAALFANSYDEQELAGTVNVRLSGQSAIDGRAGLVRRTHEQVAARDYSGVNARIRHDWMPTGKLALATYAWSEIRSWEDLAASYILGTGVSIEPSWVISSKFRLRTAFSYEERDYRGDPGFAIGAATRRNDRVQTYRASLSYNPLRNVELTLSIEQGDRRSSNALNDFSYRSAFGSIRLDF